MIKIKLDRKRVPFGKRVILMLFNLFVVQCVHNVDVLARMVTMT